MYAELRVKEVKELARHWHSQVSNSDFSDCSSWTLQHHVTWLRVAQECQIRSPVPGTCSMSLKPLELGWGDHRATSKSQLKSWGLRWPQKLRQLPQCVRHWHCGFHKSLCQHLVGTQKALFDFTQLHSLHYYSILGSKLNTPPSPTHYNYEIIQI